MLTDRPVYATLPTADVARLRRFYEDVLGFTVQQETPTTIYYGAGEGTFFAISRSSGKAAGAHTQMAFRTTNIDADVAALRERGVVFEEYELPKTVDGIADMGAGRAAWLKDPDGNLIGIFQFKAAGLHVADRERRDVFAAGPRIAIAIGSIVDLDVAEGVDATSVAFPAISTGIYGYPAARAASVAVREIAAWLDAHERPETVILSAFSADTAIVLRRALSDLGRPDLTGE